MVVRSSGTPLAAPERPNRRRESPSEGGSLAASLRGFGPVGILASLVIVALGSLGGIPVLVWAQLSRTPWRDLGFAQPKSWLRTVVIGILFGIAFKILMKVIVMPLLGADPINPAYHYLAGNRAALPGMIVTILFGAGFGEETVFRGFLFERLGRLLGHDAAARTATVVLTAALFGLVHYHDQGLAGAGQAAITGLAFGAIFSVTGRIWMLMVAHAAFDLTAVAIIYWNLESRFAHLVFT